MKKILFTLIISSLIVSCNEKGENLKGYELAYKQRSFELTHKILKDCKSKNCQAVGEYLLATLYEKKNIYDSALYHSRIALSLFKDLNDKNKIIDLEWLSAEALRKSGNHEYAIKLYSVALSLNPTQDKEMAIKLDMAKSLYIKQNRVEANNILSKTKKYFEGKNNRKFADSHLLLGNNKSDYIIESENLDNYNFSDCFEHYFIALRNYTENRNKAQALNNIGFLYTQERKFNLAKLYLDSANNMLTDPSLLSGVRYNLATVHKEMKEPIKAANLFGKVISASQRVDRHTNESYRELMLYNQKLDNDSVVEGLINEYVDRVALELNKRDLIKKIAVEQSFESILSKEEVNSVKKEKKTDLLTLGIFAGLSILLMICVVLKKHTELTTKRIELTTKHIEFTRLVTAVKKTMNNINPILSKD